MVAKGITCQDLAGEARFGKLLCTTKSAKSKTQQHIQSTSQSSIVKTELSLGSLAKASFVLHKLPKLKLQALSSMIQSKQLTLGGISYFQIPKVTCKPMNFSGKLDNECKTQN